MPSDRRVPGERGKLIFMCPVVGCSRIAYADVYAECPVHGERMVPADAKEKRQRGRRE